MSRSREPREPQGRKTYRKPILVRHGHVGTVTASKGAEANDGAAKPSTRVIGPKA